MLTTRLSSDRGSSVVTALMIVTIMLIGTFSTLAFVDTEQRESGRERKRESTFQLTEGAMTSQIYVLSRNWPGTAFNKYPVCTQLINDDRCPDPARLSGIYVGPDYKNVTWKTEVHDNTAPTYSNYYDDAFIRSQPTYDVNKDSYVWVRSEAKLGDGKQRVIVALVKAEIIAINFPQAAVIAGRIQLSANGNVRYIDTDGQGTNNGTKGRVIVRCSPGTSTYCSGEDPAKADQIGPQEVEGLPTYPSALTPETIDRLRDRAKGSGTWYGPGSPDGACPTTLTGSMIFIEDASPCPVYDNTGNTSFNALGDYGVVVAAKGTLRFGKNARYFGIVYHANQDNQSSLVVEIAGCGVVIGQVIIDGPGLMNVGACQGTAHYDGNIVFDPNANSAIKGFGTAGIVQNSFREIRPAN